MFFKKAKNQESIKRVSIYLSEKEKKIIIAPFYKNDAGIYYEQEVCTVVDYPVENSFFGEEIVRNINLFEIKDKNLRYEKSSDWPAYKASKLRTIKSFEADYSRISLSGANTSNIIFIIECISPSDRDLSITSSVSAFADKNLIGERVMKVYRACMSTDFSNR